MERFGNMSTENIFVVDKIDEKSWRINDNGARIFLFVGTKKALMVDSGYGSGDLKSVVTGLTMLPIMLVNTHGDYDHIGNNAQFEMAYMHPAEFARYRHENIRFFPKVGKNPPVSPLWEGDIIDLGGRSFEVIHIPGHSPGSIALLDAENCILVAGDSILDDIIAMGDVWRDFDAYIYSMQKLNAMRSRFDTIYPSHGSFPLSSDVLEGLIDGAIRCKNGEVEGVATDFIKDRDDLKIYEVGGAKFMF